MFTFLVVFASLGVLSCLFDDWDNIPVIEQKAFSCTSVYTVECYFCGEYTDEVTVVEESDIIIWKKGEPTKWYAKDPVTKLSYTFYICPECYAKRRTNLCKYLKTVEQKLEGKLNDQRSF